MNRREHIEWCDVWVAGAEADSLPRVLLIGDSIARSYYNVVARKLDGVYHSARLATSKCACDSTFSTELDLVLKEYAFSVIHFNNGLHGWEYDEEQYEKGLREAVSHMRARQEGARLVLATSTPVRAKGDLANFDPKNARILTRNEIATECALHANVPVNDLYAVTLDHPEYFSPDGVHYNEMGQQALGEKVADAIMSNPASPR